MPPASRFKYHGPILRVAVPSPLRRLFDYLPPSTSPEDVQPGARVRVPFGRRQVVGVVMDIAAGSELDAQRLKQATQLLDSQPLFTPGLFRVLNWAIQYYLHPPGDAMATALPLRLRQGEAVAPSMETWSVTDIDQEQAEALLSRAPRQRQLLHCIAEMGEASRDALLKEGFTAALLRELESKQLIRKQWRSETLVTPEPTDRSSGVRQLNEAQQQAVNAILDTTDKFSCYLLDGVTGSGKTEVYMRVMQDVLDRGRQCLVLIPEIGLTPQTLSRFQERFSCPVVSLHSGLSDTERLRAWRLANAGIAGVVIGTRSAIFACLARPGVIIVDEEHDPSFKQQDGFRYSARDLAVLRGREEAVPVILGSATPSLESLMNVQRGRYQRLCLPERAGTAKPANMQLVDVSEGIPESGFADSVLLKIGTHLDSGNQVLVFINRRGFAPVMHCLTCGWVAECEDCLAQMTVHSQPPGLHCHHCGQQEQLPVACPHCRSRELSTRGLGTQKVELLLQRQFPAVPVLRIDRDSTRSRKRFDAMLEQVHSGEPCLLLGTQMLAKGHHFPGVTLVVVVDADSGLFSADFRGQEHMAQTIVQVSGRAGRARQSGEVLIQSRHASHETLQALTQLRYSEFALRLLDERQLASMPPFSHLALLRCEARSAEQGLQFLQNAQQQAAMIIRQGQLHVECLGPLPAPMEKRAGRYRSQLSLQSEDRATLHGLLSQLLASLDNFKAPTGLRWHLDVDPQDMI